MLPVHPKQRHTCVTYRGPPKSFHSLLTQEKTSAMCDWSVWLYACLRLIYTTGACDARTRTHTVRGGAAYTKSKNLTKKLFGFTLRQWCQTWQRGSRKLHIVFVHHKVVPAWKSLQFCFKSLKLASFSLCHACLFLKLHVDNDNGIKFLLLIWQLSWQWSK